jgi:hypothetical protein
VGEQLAHSICFEEAGSAQPDDRREGTFVERSEFCLECSGGTMAEELVQLRRSIVTFMSNNGTRRRRDCRWGRG